MPRAEYGVFRQLGQAASIGAMLAACIFVGTGLGVLLDRWLGTKPWLTLLFICLGIVAGFYNVARIASTLNGKNKSGQV